MEIIIGLVILGLATAAYFSFKKKEEAVVEPVTEPTPAAYKVEVVPVAHADVLVTTLAVEGAGEVAVPAKAPRKPRAPKAEVAVAKKSAAKKAPAKAKATEATAKKPAARTAKSKKI